MRRRLSILLTVGALALVGCGSDDDDGTSGSGKDGSAERGFEGDPELDGLKPGDCAKYPELDACN